MAYSLTAALIAELAKKTSVCWLRYAVGDDPATEHAAWHVWHDDALLLVSGGPEQPLPGIAETDRVEVTMRSKDNGGRLVTWVGRPVTLRPGSEAWEPAVAALAAARLNIPSLTETPKTWAAESVVTRVQPTGEVLEEPGALPADSLAAPPRPTRAVTRGALPRVLHRRQRRRPRLS